MTDDFSSSILVLSPIRKALWKEITLGDFLGKVLNTADLADIVLRKVVVRKERSHFFVFDVINWAQSLASIVPGLDVIHVTLIGHLD